MTRQAHANMPSLRFILYGDDDASRQALARRLPPESTLPRGDALAADAGVVRVDVRRGLLTETRRRIYLASLLGLRRVALAIDHLDAVGYSKDAFERVAADCSAYAQRIGLQDAVCIPVSSEHADSVAAPSANILEKKLHASACIPTCSMATTSAMALTRTLASPKPTASRTSAASPRWRD